MESSNSAASNFRLELQTTSFNGCLVTQSFLYVKVWNHPTATTRCFGVAGGT